METVHERPTTSRRPGRASGRARVREEPASRDEYDLLTALLMGVAVGSLVTLLFRRGPSGRRPAGTALRLAGSGAAAAGRYGARGARWAADRGAGLVERLPETADVVDEVGDYLSTVREAINDTVVGELKDLRRAIRRQRKRVGL